MDLNGDYVESWRRNELWFKERHDRDLVDLGCTPSALPHEIRDQATIAHAHVSSAVGDRREFLQRWVVGLGGSLMDSCVGESLLRAGAEHDSHGAISKLSEAMAWGFFQWMAWRALDDGSEEYCGARAKYLLSEACGGIPLPFVVAITILTGDEEPGWFRSFPPDLVDGDFAGPFDLDEVGWAPACWLHGMRALVTGDAELAQRARLAADARAAKRKAKRIPAPERYALQVARTVDAALGADTTELMAQLEAQLEIHQRMAGAQGMRYNWFAWGRDGGNLGRALSADFCALATVKLRPELRARIPDSLPSLPLEYLGT